MCPRTSLSLGQRVHRRRRPRPFSLPLGFTSRRRALIYSAHKRCSQITVRFMTLLLHPGEHVLSYDKSSRNVKPPHSWARARARGRAAGAEQPRVPLALPVSVEALPFPFFGRLSTRTRDFSSFLDGPREKSIRSAVPGQLSVSAPLGIPSEHYVSYAPGTLEFWAGGRAARFTDQESWDSGELLLAIAWGNDSSIVTILRRSVSLCANIAR